MKNKKRILIIVAITFVIVSLIKVNYGIQRSFIENCESKGYTHKYCVLHS